MGSSSISAEQVQRVAKLARLYLSPSACDEMTAQLGRVVEYIHRLDQLDTSEVEPLAHAADIANVFADDISRPSLDREAALGNAPQRDSECFRVPAVLGD